MATKQMNAEIRIRLTDRFSAGLGALQRRLEGITNVMQRLGRIGSIGVLGGGLAFAPAIARAADLETQLRSIAVTAGASARTATAEVNRMRDMLGRTALEFRESTRGLASGLDVLTARGVAPERIDSTLRLIARLRAASAAAEPDLAQLSVTLQSISRLRSPEDQERAMARLLRAGQLGGVELRDLAQSLPRILPQLDALGVKGMRGVENAGAMLQVIRDGFASPAEAAAGYTQLLGQLLSEGTIRQMRDFGVDMEGIYNSALRMAARGVDIDPVEALLEQLRRVHARNPGGIARLIPDENARNAFLAFNTNIARFLDLRNQLRRTTPGVIDEAAETRMQGLGAEMRRLSEIGSQFSDRLGALGERVLPRLNEGLGSLLELVRATDRDFPGLVDTVLLAAGGFALAAGSLGLVGAAIGLIMTPLKIIGAGLAALFSLKALALVGALAAVAGAIYLVWKNWETLIGAWNTGMDRAQGWQERDPAPRGFDPSAQAQRRLNFGGRGRASGFYGAEAAMPPPPETRVGGEIVVRAAPGTEIVDTRSRNPGVPIVAPNRGAVVAVP